MRERRRAIVYMYTRALSASRGSRACVDARESRVRELCGVCVCCLSFDELERVQTMAGRAESFSGLLTTEISASAISVRIIALPDAS